MASCTTPTTKIDESEYETDTKSDFDTKCQPVLVQTLSPTNAVESVPDTDIQSCEPVKEICLDDCEFFVVDEVGSSDEKCNEASSPTSAPVIVESNQVKEDLFCIDTNPTKEKESNDDQINKESFSLNATLETANHENNSNDLFCVDITPQTSSDKERHLGPRYRNVRIFRTFRTHMMVLLKIFLILGIRFCSHLRGWK